MIKEVNPRDVPVRTFKLCSVQKDISQFMDSSWAAAEADISGYSNVNSAVAAYRSCINRMNVNCVAVVRKNRLYLLKGDEA